MWREQQQPADGPTVDNHGAVESADLPEASCSRAAPRRLGPGGVCWWVTSREHALRARAGPPVSSFSISSSLLPDEEQYQREEEELKVL